MLWTRAARRCQQLQDSESATAPGSLGASDSKGSQPGPERGELDGAGNGPFLGHPTRNDEGEKEPWDPELRLHGILKCSVYSVYLRVFNEDLRLRRCRDQRRSALEEKATTIWPISSGPDDPIGPSG